MRTKTYLITGIDADADGISTSAAPAAGVALTLEAGAAALSPPRFLTFVGSAALSGTFTVIGTDRWGNAQTEIVSGVSTTPVRSLGIYASVTSIIPSTTDTDTLEVGWPVGNTTPWVVCGRNLGTDQVPTCLVSVLAEAGTVTGEVDTTYDMFPRLTEPEIDIDETDGITPGTPVEAQGSGCRFRLTSGAGTTAKVKFLRAGPSP